MTCPNTISFETLMAASAVLLVLLPRIEAKVHILSFVPKKTPACSPVEDTWLHIALRGSS